MYKQEKIGSLQAIRAIAFIGIFLAHGGILGLGACGVSIFVVLSGFLMVFRYFDRPIALDKSFKFALAKIKKLYPLHIIMTILTLLFLYMISGAPNIVCILFRYGIEVIVSIFLLYSWIPGSARWFRSLNHVSWYLSVVFFTALIFPTILKQLKKIKTIRGYVCMGG